MPRASNSYTGGGDEKFQRLLARLSMLSTVCRSSILARTTCPLRAAYESGARPSLSGLLGLTSSRPSSSFTIAVHGVTSKSPLQTWRLVVFYYDKIILFFKSQYIVLSTG